MLIDIIKSKGLIYCKLCYQSFLDFSKKHYYKIERTKMQEDDIINFLNNEKEVKFKHGKTKQPKPQQQVLTQKREGQDNPLDIIDDFQNMYENRLHKMEHKNEIKQLELKKKRELKQAAQKKYQMKPIIPSDEQEIKLPTIRYLIFKNYSGNHMEYQVTDNGYKFRFTNGMVGLVKHLLQQNGFIQAFNNEGTILWNIGVPSPSIYQSMTAYQKINHFPKSYQITRKDLMLQNLSKMKHKNPNQYNFFPVTFILPNQSSAFMDEAEKNKNANKWYIVKPHNKSQGKGIWLSNRPDEILKKQKQCIVVSQYIHNPLLVNGLKFDMRIYVGITCWNPLRIYIYQDGLARFATSQYSSDLSSKENLFVHLTNYSLNKYSENFIANDDADDSAKGHKWSLIALKQFFNKNGLDVPMIWSRIEDMIVKTIISIENTVYHSMQMSVPYRDNCFQVLGFDILLDDALRPWLLQINLSPSLNTDSPLDLKIKGSMLADLFTMMGVVPLDQRFSIDKSYLLNSNKMFTSKQFKHQFSKLQRLVLKQSEDELKRSGGWKRIFPTETAFKYKQLFDIDRPLNRLLREQQIKKTKNQKVSQSTKQPLVTIQQK